MKRSLVRKERSEEDRREFLVMLSESGVAMINTLENQMESNLNIFINDIPSDSREKFIEIIEQLNWKLNSYLHEL